MTELTSAKLQLACLAIEALRLRGELGMDEPVSPERIARISQEAGHPVDAATVRRIERRFLLLARLALTAHSQARPQS